jgi:hypothetical protein
VPFFFLFLFIPVIPFLGKREPRKCPICGYEARGNEKFCPFDGTELPGPGV